MGRRGKKVIRQAVDLCVAAAAFVLAGMMLWHYVLSAPCRVETDCRGQGVEAEMLQQWQQRETGEALGITGMAGWRTQEWQTVTSVSTGRRQRAELIGVYGDMELVMPSKILDGRYGLSADIDYCVLSQGLAGHLFGSPEVTGECVKVGKERYIVAGVVENQEDIMMIPVKDGQVERIALSFDSRMGAEEKMRQVMEELGVR